MVQIGVSQRSAPSETRLLMRRFTLGTNRRRRLWLPDRSTTGQNRNRSIRSTTASRRMCGSTAIRTRYTTRLVGFRCWAQYMYARLIAVLRFAACFVACFVARDQGPVGDEARSCRASISRRDRPVIPLELPNPRATLSTEQRSFDLVGVKAPTAGHLMRVITCQVGWIGEIAVSLLA